MTAAPLRLVCDFDPGLTRVGERGRFTYLTAVGTEIEDPAVLDGYGRWGCPPAWTSVWIAPDPNDHLQATGFDSRGRKQYRYHPAWRRERDEVKFEDMQTFGHAQPLLRRRIKRDLRAEGELGHRRVLALALRLLDVGLFRVGTDRYARDNEHYGLTTLLDQVVVRDGQAVLDYVGKAGKRQPHVDRRSPGRGGAGAAPAATLGATRANGLQRTTRMDPDPPRGRQQLPARESGGPFSAKEYRTWNATVITAATLGHRRAAVTRAPVVASKAVAHALGNTPAVARQSYIDPRVFERYASGSAIALDDLPRDPWRARARIEARVLGLLATGSR